MINGRYLSIQEAEIAWEKYWEDINKFHGNWRIPVTQILPDGTRRTMTTKQFLILKGRIRTK